MNPKAKRTANIITIAVFLGIIYLFSAIFILLPDKEISEQENRALQQFPDISLKNLFSGDLTKQLGEYYSDQFPARDIFVGVKTAFSYSMLKNENKGAVIAKDGYLIQRFDIYDRFENDFDTKFTFNEEMNLIIKNAEYINTFARDIKASHGIDIAVIIPPRKVDAMLNKLPEFFPSYRHEMYYQTFNSHIDENIYIPLNELLISKNNEYIYFRTDHHWTVLGAHYAYEALGSSLGYNPIPLTNFDEKRVSEGFYGTTWSKTGAKWIKPDEIIYYTMENEESDYITVTGERILDGFYDYEKLQTKDKYSFFIGGISPIINIYAKTQDSGREKLLLITDSFGLPLVPFLARHFDIDVIDLRFFSQSLPGYITENGIDKVLILQNMESLSTQTNLRMLGLK